MIEKMSNFTSSTQQTGMNMPEVHNSSDKHYVEIFLVTLFGDYTILLAKRMEERKKICSKTILHSGQLKKYNVKTRSKCWLVYLIGTQ